MGPKHVGRFVDPQSRKLGAIHDCETVSILKNLMKNKAFGPYAGFTSNICMWREPVSLFATLRR